MSAGEVADDRDLLHANYNGITIEEQLGLFLAAARIATIEASAAMGFAARKFSATGRGSTN